MPYSYFRWLRPASVFLSIITCICWAFSCHYLHQQLLRGPLFFGGKTIAFAVLIFLPLTIASILLFAFTPSLGRYTLIALLCSVSVLQPMLFLLLIRCSGHGTHCLYLSIVQAMAAAVFLPLFSVRVQRLKDSKLSFQHK